VFAYDCRRESCSYKLAGETHNSSGWEIELRIGRRLIVKDECIVSRSAKIVNRKLT